MSLYTGKEIYSDDWVELTIDENIVKRVEELYRIEKQPTFDQYPMFYWTSVIKIMDNITETEYEESNEENSEGKPTEAILEEIIEEEAIYENPPEGFLISEKTDSKTPNNDTYKELIG